MRERRTASDQRAFYDEYFRSQIDLPVERLKQAARLRVLGELIGERRPSRFLVVGCGAGGEITLLPPESTFALDLSIVGVQSARRKHPEVCFLQADGTQLPFKDESFALVLCSEVIEHVLSPQDLVSELARVLAPNGQLILSTPNWISWWGLARRLGERLLRRPITSGGQPVDNWFTPHDLRVLLSRHFIIETWRGVWYFPPTGAGLQRLPDRLVAPLFRFFLPLERLWGRLTPTLGHLHAVRAVRKG